MTPWWQTLQRAEGFTHPVSRFELIETHISWVLLTGEYAYKFKKPVDLGFLDFSTLARRRHFCEEELRLNARLAPHLYLAVVAVTGTPDAPRIEVLEHDTPTPHGPIIEYGIKMRQFDQATQFDRLLARGALTPRHIDRLAERIARFHQNIATADPSSTYASTTAVVQPMRENFAQLRMAATAHPELHTVLPLLHTLERWSDQQHTQLHDVLVGRQQAGFIRECHGDMHLRNIALFEDDIVVFDGIEFSANLRWIDVMSEVAFLIMDLFDHDRSALAWRCLNAYLSRTGDYAGLTLLRYYLVYRAMVRAKVSAIQLTQSVADASGRTATLAECRTYIDLAQHFTRPGPIWLCLTHGVSGTGKTWYSQALLETLGALRLRSDVERKRLHGLPALARSGARTRHGIYTLTATRRTYARLLELADTIVRAGYPVIVDATFLRHAQRQVFADLARTQRIPWVILAFEAPETVLHARIVARQAHAQDASEASLCVLAEQLSRREPLDAHEQTCTLSIDTGESGGIGDGAIAALLTRLRTHLGL